MLDIANLFVADVPIKKKQKIWSPSPSAHFEISVQKPPMHETVKQRARPYRDTAQRAQILFMGPRL